jgi:type II secretory pathway component GspD/PulD (secretin)
MQTSHAKKQSRWAIVAVFAGLQAFAWAGEAPEKESGKQDEKADKAVAEKKEEGVWQARVSAKILEWSGKTDLDYGFSIAYFRDPAHPNSIVGPFNDGRGRSGDPDAFATFPSQSSLDLGLRIFLDQMNANNGTIEAVIEALEQRGDVEMLAEPTLVLRKAESPTPLPSAKIEKGDAAVSTVRTGSRIPYSHEQVAGFGGVAEVTLFQDTGVVLSVAFLDIAELDDLYAKMQIIADVTSLAGYVTVTPKHPVPQVNSRHIENIVLIRDRTTLIAGILKEDAKVSNAQGPPILGDIPILKHLVRNRSQSNMTHEILFLMNVVLIPPGAI